MVYDMNKKNIRLCFEIKKSILTSDSCIIAGCLICFLVLLNTRASTNKGKYHSLLGVVLEILKQTVVDLNRTGTRTINIV